MSDRIRNDRGQLTPAAEPAGASSVQETPERETEILNTETTVQTTAEKRGQFTPAAVPAGASSVQETPERETEILNTETVAQTTAETTIAERQYTMRKSIGIAEGTQRSELEEIATKSRGWCRLLNGIVENYDNHRMQELRISTARSSSVHTNPGGIAALVLAVCFVKKPIDSLVLETPPMR